MNEYYIHWTSGHREGWTPIAFTEQEAAEIVKNRKAADPDVQIELMPAREKEEQR